MKRKKSEPKLVPSQARPIIPPTPSSLQEFQQVFGGEWIRIIQHPAFRSATLLLNVRKLEGITNLTNDQIESHGKEILADLRGHLQLENSLMSLHEMQDFKLPLEEPDIYVSPEEQGTMGLALEKFREQRQPK
jgi:hypothetical protein